MYYFMDGFDNTQDIQGAQSFTGFAYRFDVLQANNLTPATTLDEFTTLCASLQGLIDSGASDAQYVMMNSTKDYAFYRGFVGIYHTWDTLYWNGSEWAFGPVEDNFREMLAYLNTLWDAGYIDPEMGTADYNAGTTKASTVITSYSIHYTKLYDPLITIKTVGSPASCAAFNNSSPPIPGI